VAEFFEEPDQPLFDRETAVVVADSNLHDPTHAGSNRSRYCEIVRAQSR
jgi:hypothetical protein